MASEREIDATYRRVRGSFGPNAAKYTASPGHADTKALARLVATIAPRKTDRVLDLGTGTGHTGIAFAPAVAAVMALDLTREMLHEARRNAGARGITNLAVQQAAAEALPFGTGAFDVVACRLTTHHFAALGKATHEMARVLAPEGRLVIVDTMVPEDDDLDRQINAIEWLRDPSHVRNCRPSEWRALVERAGLAVTRIDTDYYDEGDGMSFNAWTERIGTTRENVAKLRRLLRDAEPRLRATLRIEPDGDDIRFALPRITLVATKPLHHHLA